MKKTVSLLLAIIMVLTLAACGNAPEGSSAPQSSSQVSSEELTPFEQGKKCFEGGDWIGAIEILKTISTLDETYKDAQELLKKANDEYVKMVIAEVENRVKTDTPENVINYIIESQKVSYLPELIEELDNQYKLYTDDLTAEASKLYDEGKTEEAAKVFDDAFTRTGFDQVTKAKEAFLKSKAVYLMKDIMPSKQPLIVGTSTEINDGRGVAPEVIAFGLQEKGKATMVFNINGEYSRLLGTVFVPKECEDTYSGASVKIIIDGSERFSRTKLKKGFVAVDFDLNVKGKKKITFEIVGGMTGEKTNYPWIADAYVIK